jgi:integrase
MQLMLHAGLRAAEVLALTVYDLDWLSGQLTVRQGKGKNDGSDIQVMLAGNGCFATR